MTTTDANGHEIDLAHRGLRVCDWCGLVMSEGFIAADGDGYACSEKCLADDPGWVTEPDKHTWALGLPVENSGNVHVTNELIGLWLEDEEAGGPTCTIFWTDWEGDDSHEDATERLKSAPYNFESWLVEVQVNYTRTYEVTARSEAEAIELYHAGQGDLDRFEGDAVSLTADEDANTATARKEVE